MAVASLEAPTRTRHLRTDATPWAVPAIAIMLAVSLLVSALPCCSAAAMSLCQSIWYAACPGRVRLWTLGLLRQATLARDEKLGMA